MWEELDPHSASVDQAYAPLLAAARQRTEPWSLVELKLCKSDIQWLQQWFEYLDSARLVDWARSVRVVSMGGESVVGLLLCLGAETCRESGTEDSVWPIIRGLLPTSHPLKERLFLTNGQPSSLFRELIGNAVRSLNLRHVMDVEGTQQWFVTIKLQFGFTLRGAKSRLAEWLVGLGAPMAVLYLIGEPDSPDLASDNFQSLWRTLRQYRKGWIEDDQCRTVLESSPWVKPHWLKDLLDEARSRIETLGREEWDPNSPLTQVHETPETEANPIRGVMLDWPFGTSPRLRFHLDEEAITNNTRGTIVNELDFYIDGQRLCRWLLQPDGSWAGDRMISAEPEKSKGQPNLQPRTLTICSRALDVLMEWDLEASGLMEDVLVFDLDRECLLEAAGHPLDCRHRYAILCDGTSIIEGCVAAETFDARGSVRKAVRLPKPISDNLLISYEGFMLWQPVEPNYDRKPPFALSLTSAESGVIALGDQITVKVDGLPDEAEEVELLIHRKVRELEGSDAGWCTAKKVTITPELATKQRRLRVKFLSDGQRHSIKPSLRFQILGAAMIRQEQDSIVNFKKLGNGDVINCSEGTASVRIWTPNQDAHALALEGDYTIGRLSYSRIRLRDVPGFGGELGVLEKGQKSELGIYCHDRGCVRAFLPALMKDRVSAQIFLHRELDTSDPGYAVCEWSESDSGVAQLCILPEDVMLPNSTPQCLQLSTSSNPLAVALAYRGDWIGAWWDLPRIRDYIETRRKLSRSDFSSLRWLRVPVLDPALKPQLTRAALASPVQFITGWFDGEGIPEELRPNEDTIGADSVVRQFLWNDFPSGQSKDVIAVAGQCESRLDLQACCGHLEKLSRLSLPLLWAGFGECKRRCKRKSQDVYELFLRSRVDLTTDDDDRSLDLRLNRLKDNLLRRIGLTAGKLEDIEDDRIRLLDRFSNAVSPEDRRILLKIGESYGGRAYIAARLVECWID